MTDNLVTDWDDAYANAAHIEGAEDFPPRWADGAAAFRKNWATKELDIGYGRSSRQKFDLFFPTQASKGLVVFVHGGFWLKFDKSYWSKYASGALAHGWTVCLPSYDLSPDVRISDITRQIGSAICLAAERVNGPIRLTGHSAGGHLVTRMVCDDTPLSDAVLNRVEAVVSISGLHDLRPLRKTKMNLSFGLSEDDAVAESAALKKPKKNCSVTAWVGSLERPEFVRQSRLLSQTWPDVMYHEEPGKHHFDVIDDLQIAESELMSVLVGK